MSQRKTLIQHVQERSFAPSRNEWLLSVDESVARHVVCDPDEVEYIGRLHDLQLWYRHAARNEAERRSAAFAFRDAMHGRYQGYFELMGGVLWEQASDGDWRLVPCDCRFCTGV